MSIAISKIEYKDGAIKAFEKKKVIGTFPTAHFTDDQYAVLVGKLEDSLTLRKWEKKAGYWTKGNKGEALEVKSAEAFEKSLAAMVVPDKAAKKPKKVKGTAVKAADENSVAENKTVTLETTRDALAYVAITGSIVSLHKRTVEQLAHYWTIGEDGKVTLTEEGKAIAEKARMFKAHNHLVAAGYNYFNSTNLALLRYKNESNRYASTGWKGRVSINSKEVAKYKNG